MAKRIRVEVLCRLPSGGKTLPLMPPAILLKNYGFLLFTQNFLRLNNVTPSEAMLIAALISFPLLVWLAVYGTTRAKAAEFWGAILYGHMPAIGALEFDRRVGNERPLEYYQEYERNLRADHQAQFDAMNAAGVGMMTSYEFERRLRAGYEERLFTPLQLIGQIAAFAGLLVAPFVVGALSSWGWGLAWFVCFGGAFRFFASGVPPYDLRWKEIFEANHRLHIQYPPPQFDEYRPDMRNSSVGR